MNDKEKSKTVKLSQNHQERSRTIKKSQKKDETIKDDQRRCNESFIYKMFFYFGKVKLFLPTFHFSIIFLFLNLSYLFKRKTKHGTKWYKMCTN